MAETSPREVINRFAEALNGGDWDAAMACVHPDFVDEYPQSGERIRGRDNLRAILSNYPGGFKAGTPGPGSPRIVGGEDRWLMTPNFTVLRVTGASDVYTVVTKAHYPDGSQWHVVALAELKDSLIWRQTTFFAPAFEAPAWRAQWVERIESGV